MRPPLRVLLLGVLAAACGKKPDPPPEPPPPKVVLTLREAVVIGSKIDLDVAVTGCDTVESVDFLERGELLRKISYGQTPTASSVAATDFSFRGRTLAAEVLLTARATCDDGRVGESAPAPARFLPVAEVISLPGDTYVVPELFIAEGQGQSVTFLGCSGVTGGSPTLIRVDRAGRVVRTMEGAPFPCSLRSIISERHPVTGKRWLLEPDVGAYAFDTGLHVTAFRTGKLSALGVGPEGDALLWDRSVSFEALHRIRHSDNGEGWLTGFQPQGLLTGNPIVKDGYVLLPIWISQIGSNTGTLAIELVDYVTTQRKGRYDLMEITYPFLDLPNIPSTSFSADGNWIYVPTQPANNHSLVTSCSTAAQPCATDARQWVSPTLVGAVSLVTPFAAGRHVAAVAAQNTWFLDAANGRAVNPGAVSLTPPGALVANSVLEGKGVSAKAANPEASCGAAPCQDFYLFNGPAANAATLPTPLPLEIVALDAPSRDPVFRFELASGNLTAAVDDGGALWLRVGPKLIRPFSLSEYRKMRGQ